MLVNPEVQDYLDRLQGRSRGGGLAPGRGVVSTPNYAGEALGSIIRPNVSSFGFRGAIPTELNLPRFRPTPPAPNPAERGALGQEVPGPVRGAGGSLGGEYKAAGLQKLGQGIEQMLSDLAEKRKQAEENAATANAVPKLPPLQPHGGTPGAGGKAGETAAPAPVPYPGAAPITTPAIGPAGGPNPLIGQGLGIRGGSAPFSIGGGTSLPLIASAGGTGGGTGGGATTASEIDPEFDPKGLGAKLQPKLADLVQDTLQDAADQGVHAVVTSGYRSPAEQEKLYAQSRTAPGPRVTNASAGQSYHNWGAAADVNPVGGTGTAEQYRIIGDAAKNLGLTWGGDFKSIKDLDHIQLPGTLAEARAGYEARPPGGAAVVAAATGLKYPENNNPFNIKYVGQPGVTASANTDQGDPQAVYSSYGAGVDAARDLALKKYNAGMTSAASIIAAKGGWTPGNMEAAKHVADSVGFGVNDDLKLNDPAAMRAFLRALLEKEQGAGALPYFDQLANAPAAGSPSVALPPTATAIADINKPPAVAAAPQPATVAAAPTRAPAPAPVAPSSAPGTQAGSYGGQPYSYATPGGPSSAAGFGRQSMNVPPPSQQDLLASALAQNQPAAPPPVDPNMLALALQGGGAPDFSNFSGGGFFG
jgi:hypothetical protein